MALWQNYSRLVIVHPRYIRSLVVGYPNNSKFQVKKLQGVVAFKRRHSLHISLQAELWQQGAVVHLAEVDIACQIMTIGKRQWISGRIIPSWSLFILYKVLG